MNDIQVERLIRRLLRWSILAVVIAALIAVSFTAGRCSAGGSEDTLSVRVDSFRDTTYVEVHDTVPMIKQEKVVCYVKIPTKSEHDIADTLKNCDSLNMAVVQREYSDDSTYTAWVSGVRYDVWPKLDSISVRQREITKTVHETVTLVERKKTSRFSVGLIGGYGYGLGYRGFEPFVGVGVSYRIFPP